MLFMYRDGNMLKIGVGSYLGTWYIYMLLDGSDVFRFFKDGALTADLYMNDEYLLCSLAMNAASISLQRKLKHRRFPLGRMDKRIVCVSADMND